MATTTKTAATRRILRRKQLEQLLGLSRSTLYSKLKFNPKRPNEYDPDFPRPIPLGAGAVGWLESEIDDWLDQQIQKRDQGDVLK